MIGIYFKLYIFIQNYNKYNKLFYKKKIILYSLLLQKNYNYKSRVIYSF